jgi:hypothetical protein
MKARKNKKRIDTKYQMPREEKSTVKEDIDFNDFSFDSWLIHEMYPEAGSMPTGEDYRSRGKRRDGLPEEIPKDDPRDKANRDVNSPMEEGHCAAEMPLEDAEEEVAPHHPDNAFESGYAAAVEEIMASIEGLLGDPIEMAPVGPEMDIEQLPDHAMEINEDADEDDLHHEFVSLVGDEEIKTLAQAIIKLKDGWTHGIKKKDDDRVEALEMEFSDLVGKKMNVATDWKVQDKLEDKILKKIKDDSQQNIKDKMMRSGASSEETMAYLQKQGVVVEEEKKPDAEVKEEDMMKKSLKDSPYADMPSVEVRLNRKEPGVKETVPMVDSARSRNPEALKDIIRNWLGVGYGVDEVELTSDGQALDVAEFLDIDPMEEA